MSPDHNDVYQEALALCKQQLTSPTASGANRNSSQADAAQQPDAALMDFWLLLQQTQSNLQVRATLDGTSGAQPACNCASVSSTVSIGETCKLTPPGCANTLSPFLPVNTLCAGHAG